MIEIKLFLDGQRGQLDEIYEALGKSFVLDSTLLHFPLYKIII